MIPVPLGKNKFR